MKPKSVHSIVSKQLLAVTAAAALISTSHAAVVTWTADAFDAASDISTVGTLVKAVNLGSTTGVTVNGVLFAGEATFSTTVGAGTSSLYTTNATDYTNTGVYLAGAVAGLSATDAATLLDTVEYSNGVGNSLARLTGLTIGFQYTFQTLIVDDRAGGTSTMSLGHAATFGGAKVYTLLTQDVSGTALAPQVKIFTGTFTADAATQDLHFSSGNATNGFANAFQLRSVPEPSAALLGGLGMLALLRRRRN